MLTKSKIARIAVILFLVTLPLLGQGNRGKAEATVKGKKISITYGLPKLAGRDLIGMATPGMVWRLGMNEATEIETTGTLVVGGKELKPGKYTLWAKKAGATQWILGFHTQTGVWGEPALTTGYAAELPLKIEKAEKSAEELAIRVVDQTGEAAITIHWGTSQLSATLGVK